MIIASIVAIWAEPLIELLSDNQRSRIQRIGLIPDDKSAE